MNPRLLQILLTDYVAAAVVATLVDHILSRHRGWLYLQPRSGMSYGMCHDAVQEACTYRRDLLTGADGARRTTALRQLLVYECEAVYEYAYELAERVNPNLRERYKPADIIDRSELPANHPSA